MPAASRVPTLVLSLLVLASCGQPSSTSSGSPPPWTVEGSWELVSASTPDGRLEPIPQHPVTLRVEDDEVQGTAACNGYGATADHGGQTFRVRDILVTEMACPGAGVMELEQAYLTGLSAVENAHLSSGRLVLSGDGVQLEFRAVSGEERG